MSMSGDDPDYLACRHNLVKGSDDVVHSDGRRIHRCGRPDLLRVAGSGRITVK